MSHKLRLEAIIIIIIRNGAKTISLQTSFGDLIIRIIMTRFDCVWMQTQKFPNDPHIRIRACGCKFHHYKPIPHFKILLDINFHWNRRPLTIWRPTMDINLQHHNLPNFVPIGRFLYFGGYFESKMATIANQIGRHFH